MKKAVIKSTRLDGQDKRRDSQTVALLANAQQTNPLAEHWQVALADSFWRNVLQP